VLDIGPAIDVEVSGVTITGGGGVAQGGGVFAGGRLTLRDAAVTGNAASATSAFSRQGGGVFVNDHARLERVLIAGNTLTAAAADSFAPQGGGLFVNDDSTLENVTITGNTIDGTAGGSFGPQGGGLFVNDAVTMGGITIAGNTAVDADSQGGGIFYNDDTTVRGVIVAGNRGGGVPDECYTNDVVTSDGTNLATNAADCGFTAGGDQSADPLLAPLANTGGPSDTHALGAGSPALDRIPFAGCPATDQRGLPRAGAGAACDIGAHENGAAAPVPPPAQPPPPAPAPVAKPTPPVFVAAGVFRLPSTKRCVSRRSFRIRLRQPRGVTLKEARVFVNGRRVRVVRGKRLSAPVDLRGLPKGRFTVQVTVTATDGRKLTERRRYRTCTPKRR
jgi:putative cofactor-binding repeat protein